MIVVVSLLLWKIGESMAGFCCCGRSMNQWPDFAEGWLARVGVDGEDEVVSLCQR